MEKTWTYLFMISGMTLVFYFSGLASASGNLLGILLNIENFNSTYFWSIFVGGLSIASLGSIVVGLYTKNIELSLMLPLATYVTVLGFEFIKVYIYLASLNSVLATLFFAPFIMLYPMVIIEYWRGRDT